jgi:hypothetical protein
MKLRAATPMLLLAFLFCACGPAEEPAAPEQPPADAGPATEQIDPDDAAILVRPFTAEQIRDEWVEGFTLTMRRVRSGQEGRDRWTVVQADADGVEIEFAAIDEAGDVLGQPRVERSSWLELRDHAAFPADRTTRESVVRETPLGMLDGWLYTRRDPDVGTTTEFFFAESLPGAPVEMTVRRGDQVVMELAQIERSKPGEP